REHDGGRDGRRVDRDVGDAEIVAGHDRGMPRACGSDVPSDGHDRRGCAEVTKLEVRVPEKERGLDRGHGSDSRDAADEPRWPARAQEAPLRLAIAGLVHGHVAGFLRAAQARKDVRIVGVFDADAALQRQYAERYGLPASVMFTELDTMLDRARPEAVASFTNTFDHPLVVEAAATRRVHVM